MSISEEEISFVFIIAPQSSIKFSGELMSFAEIKINIDAIKNRFILFYL